MVFRINNYYFHLISVILISFNKKFSKATWKFVKLKILKFQACHNLIIDLFKSITVIAINLR
jgi:hypothetical protein